MNRLLEKRNTIYGFCALWIVLFHIFRKISMPFIPVVTNIVCIGNFAVDIFFFLSGVCLYLSAANHNYSENGWGDYFKRRFIRVIIPYLIIGIPFYIWASMFESKGSFLHKAVVFAANISSASFWLRGMQTTWFVYGIVVFYLLFPVIYNFLNKHDLRKVILLVTIMIGFAIVSSYIPILKNSIVVWARLPIFTLGVIAGKYQRKEYEIATGKLACAVIILLSLGFIISMSELSEVYDMPQVYRLLLYIPMTIAFCLVVSAAGRRNRILDFIGVFSLEMYLIHITSLHPLNYYGIMDLVGYWLYLILPLGAILASWLVSRLETFILSRLSESK